MVFVSGIAGQLFRDQTLTVTFAQLISLMIGITLVPMLTAWRARLDVAEKPLADDAGEPRATLRALTTFASGLVANLGVSHLVRRWQPLTRPAHTRFAAFRWAVAAIRWFFGLLAWAALRLTITFVVRSMRVLFGLTGKAFAVVLSPFLSATQWAYRSLDRRYPDMLGWALERRAIVLLTSFGLLAATALILPKLGTELIPQLSQGEFSVK